MQRGRDFAMKMTKAVSEQPLWSKDKIKYLTTYFTQIEARDGNWGTGQLPSYVESSESKTTRTFENDL